MTPCEEYLSVTPAPDRAELTRLAPTTQAEVRFEFGHDPRGTSRLVVALAHADPQVVAQAREAWLASLRAAGHRAFVV